MPNSGCPIKSEWLVHSSKPLRDQIVVWDQLATVRGNTILLIRSFSDLIRARRTTFCLLACIVLFLTALSRYSVSYVSSDSVPREPETFRLAHSLCETGKFANPFAALDTGPSAHLSPVFPSFLALLMKLFGDGSNGIYAIRLAAALILSLELALYPVFSRMLGMGEMNGIIGASIWIVAKPKIVYDHEELYVAILVAVACCCYRRYLDEEAQEHRRLAWPLGILMGFLILTSQTAAPVYAAWLGWEVWRLKYVFFQRSLLPLVLMPVVIISPWTIRNYLVFHSFTPIRDNFGLELSVSNTDCARFGIRANEWTGCFEKIHPNKSVNEARKVMELGEINYNALRLREALDWISSHPARFIKLSAMRFIAFWMPTENFDILNASGRRLERAAIYLMTLLSGLGFVILCRRDIKSGVLLISCLTVFPLVYYIVQFEYRYRYSIMWMTFLLGAMPLTACARQLGETLRVSLHGHGADSKIKSNRPAKLPPLMR
jgi:hypothetical protein